MLRYFFSRPPTLDGTYRATPEPKPKPAPKPCAVSTCTQPAKPGCAGHCARCWAERRARATTLY